MSRKLLRARAAATIFLNHCGGPSYNCIELAYPHQALDGDKTPYHKGAVTDMTYIIAEPCVDVRDGACVDVCPVDCIYAMEDDEVSEPSVPRQDPPDSPALNFVPPMLYIHPEECIDCAACEPVCPVVAIFAEEDTPEQWETYINLNYEYFGIER